MSSSMHLPLQVMYFNAYQQLARCLEKHGLQPFEVEAEVVTELDDSCVVRIYFGSGFYRCEEFHTTRSALKLGDPTLLQFFASVANLCSEIREQEYKDYLSM